MLWEESPGPRDDVIKQEEEGLVPRDKRKGPGERMAVGKSAAEGWRVEGDHGMKKKQEFF